MAPQKTYLDTGIGGGLPTLDSSLGVDRALRDSEKLNAELFRNRTTPYEEQAVLYMKGLVKQVREREAALKADEVLLMLCIQGSERLQVQSVSMPSHNVVALRCMDSDGGSVQLTGHMHAITFSFRVLKQQSPEPRRKIGFEVPPPSSGG